MKEITVIAHNDLDAHAAGAIIRKRFPEASILHISTNYGKSIPYFKIAPNTEVIIADFSIPANEMESLLNAGCKITWLDHHERNYKEIEAQLAEKGLLDKIEGVRDDKKCGALLTWEWFFKDQPVPDAIMKVNSMDLWKFDVPDTIAFDAGCNLFDMRPNSYSGNMIWKDLLGTESTRLENLVNLGRPVQTYLETMYQVWCNDLAFQTSIGDKQAIVVNCKCANSLFFNSYKNKEAFDALVMYNWFSDVGRYRYSAYSPDNIKPTLDIATRFGGGGHPNACGWTSDQLVFERPKVTGAIHGTPEEIKKALAKEIQPFHELDRLREESPLVRQCAGKNATIMLRSQSFMTTFGPTNVPAVAINHPYLPDVYDAIRYTIDVVSPSGNYAKVAVSYVLTKEGVYRVGVKPLDSSVTMEAIRTAYPNGHLFNNYYWFYSEEIPVKQYQRIR